MYIYICVCVCMCVYPFVATDRIMEKKQFTIDRWAPVYHEEILDNFFPYVFFHNFWFSIILSAGTGPSIRSLNAF